MFADVEDAWVEVAARQVTDPGVQNGVETPMPDKARPVAAASNSPRIGAYLSFDDEELGASHARRTTYSGDWRAHM